VPCFRSSARALPAILRYLHRARTGDLVEIDASMRGRRRMFSPFLKIDARLRSYWRICLSPPDVRRTWLKTYGRFERPCRARAPQTLGMAETIKREAVCRSRLLPRVGGRRGWRLSNSSSGMRSPGERPASRPHGPGADAQGRDLKSLFRVSVHMWWPNIWVA